jgi:hypothetical protein
MLVGFVSNIFYSYRRTGLIATNSTFEITSDIWHNSQCFHCGVVYVITVKTVVVFGQKILSIASGALLLVFPATATFTWLLAVAYALAQLIKIIVEQNVRG